MLAKSSESLPRTRDSFFDNDDEDDDEEQNATNHTPQGISSIKIVTSKPPVYRRQSQSSNSPSASSCCSDRDVTDVSSLGGDHPNHSQRKQDHPFHLQSMRHVLLGSSAPASRPPSPADSRQDQLIKKHVRIVTNDNDQQSQHSNNHHHHHHHRHHQQPYIHGHTKEYRRVRLTSSAINRQKQQQKIERENLRILERLQHTRATRSLKRDELLTHYDRQMGYVTYTDPPIPPRIHFPSRPSSAAMMSSNYSTVDKKSTNQSRPSSASQFVNGANVRSRPVSAPTSLHGSSRSSSARRPVWNDRWQRHE